jgi:hypothetical protein
MLGLHLVLVTLHGRFTNEQDKIELVPLNTSFCVLNNEGNDGPVTFVHLISPVVVQAMYSVGRRRRQQMAANANIRNLRNDRSRAGASWGPTQPARERAGRQAGRRVWEVGVAR